MGSQSLYSWCQKHKKFGNQLLREYSDTQDINTIDYMNTQEVTWKCINKHTYKKSIASRVQAHLGCPICNIKDNTLHIGTKYGCLQIIGYSNGKYNVECTKCKKTYTMSEKEFYSKRRIKCSNDCNSQANIVGINTEIIQENQWLYNYDLVGTIHDTLKVKECIDDNVSIEYSSNNIHKITKHKKYKCTCRLCNRDYTFLSGDFEIFKGKLADGTEIYDSTAKCTHCNRGWSMQWKTVEVLKKYGIKYEAEFAINGLRGIHGVNYLAVDFRILNDDNTTNCFIECQGDQHYIDNESNTQHLKNYSYKDQIANDNLKRQYCLDNRIKLIEIPYRYLHDIEWFLIAHGVIPYI